MSPSVILINFSSYKYCHHRLHQLLSKQYILNSFNECTQIYNFQSILLLHLQNPKQFLIFIFVNL